MSNRTAILHVAYKIPGYFNNLSHERVMCTPTKTEIEHRPYAPHA